MVDRIQPGIRTFFNQDRIPRLVERFALLSHGLFMPAQVLDQTVFNPNGLITKP